MWDVFIFFFSLSLQRILRGGSSHSSQISPPLQTLRRGFRDEWRPLGERIALALQLLLLTGRRNSSPRNMSMYEYLPFFASTNMSIHVFLFFSFPLLSPSPEI